jgi:modification methylase
MQIEGLTGTYERGPTNKDPKGELIGQQAVQMPDPMGTVPGQEFNRVICRSSEHMAEIDDATVHLIVTSPPYNVNKDYEIGQSFEDWQRLMREVFAEAQRVLVFGGRIAVNIAGTGRSPYRPLQHYLTGILLDLGFVMRGEIIWTKGSSAGTSTAWGSWCSASNPSLRDVHEYILVFSKEGMKRDRTGADTISRDEFLEYTKSVWTFPTESPKRIGHPTPFPLELPKRLIQLYSFQGDLVLDPFCGSGTTCVGAAMLDRRYVGYDIVEEYCGIARRRLAEVDSAVSK